MAAGTTATSRIRWVQCEQTPEAYLPGTGWPYIVLCMRVKPFCVCGMAMWLAGRACWVGAGHNLAATGWLVDTAAVQATVVHMGSRDSGILVGGVGGGMGVTAARCWRPWPRLWLSMAGLGLGVNQLHNV